MATIRPRCTGIVDTVCPDCGAPVVQFRDDVGLVWRIEATQLPITTNLADLAGRVWVWNPQSSSWIHKFGLVRDWRDHRAEHRCTARQP